jgi:hypothetical protein
MLAEMDPVWREFWVSAGDLIKIITAILTVYYVRHTRDAIKASDENNARNLTDIHSELQKRPITPPNQNGDSTTNHENPPGH